MKTIISQKLINVLKNKIFNVISLNLFNNVEFLLNNLLNNNTSNQYFNVIFKAQQAARDIVKSISISKAVSTSQAQAVRDTSAFINDISHFETNSIIKDIPRQSVYNWVKNWYVPNIVLKSVETPETILVLHHLQYH